MGLVESPRLFIHTLARTSSIAVMARLTPVSPKSVQQAIRNEITFQRTRRDAPPSIDSRPTFLEWLRLTWLDIFTLAAIGAAAAGVRHCSQSSIVLTNAPSPSQFDIMWPPYHRLFPYNEKDAAILSSDIAYPLLDPTLSSLLAAVVCIGTPILVFILAQLQLRHFWSLNNAVFGLLYANVGGTCFQVIVKTLIGGFRPHFLAACQPDFSRSGARQGPLGIYHDWTVCTGDQGDIKNALETFPSGHTEVAFAGFLYLSLWINANLKVVGGPYQPRFWKIVALFAPLLAAVLMAGDLQMTYNHHWYDVIMGAVIGSIFAVVGYKSMFVSLWDARTNDVVLHRRRTVLKSREGVTETEAMV